MTMRNFFQEVKAVNIFH